MQPYPLISGPNVTKLAPTAHQTSGSGSSLIAPPKRTHRSVRVEVNSIDRDLVHSPLSTNFRWTFPFPVKEVKEVRLIGGTVPVPFLNIDNQWNKFTFMDNQTNYLITIPVGFYTITSLISRLQTLLNGFGGFNTYTVTQTSDGRLQVTATSGFAEFGFLFGSGDYIDTIDPKTYSVLDMKCPGRILGFGTADYTALDGATVVSAISLPNIWYPLERSYLYLSFDSSNDLRSVFRGAGRKEPSAILYHDELNIYNAPNQSYSSSPIPLTKYLNKETYDTVISPSPASLSRISYLEVSLRDMFYNPINTQGREMTLLLELVIVD
jgi:hypothetical protein